VLIAELERHMDVDGRYEPSRTQVVLDWIDDALAQIRGDDGLPVSISHDRLIAVFRDDPLAVVGTAIHLHQALEPVQQSASPNLSCRIGVAAGSAERYNSDAPTQLLIGAAVDRAGTLVRAAAPGALFVDSAVVANLALHYVTSKAGRTKSWSGTDYLSHVDEIAVDAVAPPIAFYEIKWSGEELGRIDRPVVDLGDSASENGTATQRLVGALQRWRDDHGFVLSQTGEYFYLNDRYIVGNQEISPNTKVFFVPRKPLIDGRDRVAAAVVSLGAELVGTVVKVFPTRNYAFVEVADSEGNSQHLFMHAENNVWPVSVGDELTFKVGENVRGAVVEGAKAHVRTGV
jgi:hypothetical protein